MATLQQRAAVEKLVEIGGKSVSRAMMTSKLPYSPKTAKTPKKLTESNGFKELLEEYGLTEGLITKALVNDIKKKPQRRLPELTLGAEILGMKKNIINNVNIGVFQPTDEEKEKINRLLNG